MVVFSNIIDIIALNVFIIYMVPHQDDLGRGNAKRRKFLIELGKQLGGVADQAV